ncbi:Vacuolar protein sorting-associated protein 53 [Basidiobolus ranarum]|uniref:Vacuolar protein sorting-associated protein 53 n=1 Tax=Basidiobolus ranarum TaxID=34480 RepID=A0ABR2WGH5_9FUNG
MTVEVKTPEETIEHSNELDVIHLPPKVEEALVNILNITDPLDTPGFEPVECINQIFPNEHSLRSIDSVLDKLGFRIRKIDHQLKVLVRSQTDADEETARELEVTKKTMEELFVKITLIKQKAKDSENIVQDITKDIKSLDYAKRNLTATITALRRLQMLVTAVDQLKIFAEERQYKEAGQILQAVLQLQSHFKSYQNVKQVHSITESVDSIQQNLKEQVSEDFQAGFNSQGVLKRTPQDLNDMCSLIEVIGEGFRTKMIDWFCDLHLREYRKLFTGDDEVAALDNTSRRFAWLRRLLKVYDEEYTSVFPLKWKVNEILCETFCMITRSDLNDVLAKSSDLDVTLLIKVLHLTVAFENQLARRFSSSNVTEVNSRASNASKEANSKFTKIVSICFEPYLSRYVEAQEKSLNEMFNNFRSKELEADTDPSISVFSSSTDLLYFYRETLAQCSKLSNRKPLFDLSKVFAKWLDIYGKEILLDKLPKDDKKILTKEELKLIGLVLNTTDYCLTSVAQLEEKLTEQIDENFKQHVSLEKQREAFLGVINSCVRVLVQGIDTLCESKLNAMTKVTWGTVDTAKNQLEYVTGLGTILEENVAIIRQSITNEKYFRTFCDKFVGTFINRYMTNIFKCKRITESVAERMLSDIQVVKAILLRLPFSGMPESGTPPSTYVKFVNKGASRLEGLLKVILAPMTPQENPDAFIEKYILLCPDATFINYQKVLELKGLKRPEMQPFLDAYHKKIPNPPSENSPHMYPLTLGLNLSDATHATTQYVSTTSSLASAKFRKLMAGMAMKKEPSNNGI